MLLHACGVSKWLNQARDDRNQALTRPFVAIGVEPSRDGRFEEILNGEISARAYLWPNV